MHGAWPPDVRAKERVVKIEIWTDSLGFVRNSYKIRANLYEVMPTARLQACPGLPLFVLGTAWLWWMLLGHDFHWMMGNENGP